MTDTIENIELKITNIKNYIANCSMRVAGGENIDLTSLNEEIEKICDEILSMPQDSARKFKNHLKSVIISLDKLVNIIQEKQLEK